MKISATTLAAVTFFLLASSPALAANGYWNAKGDSVWRSGYGECIHTGFWNIELAIVGCDGKVAEAAPQPEAAPLPVAKGSADTRVNFGFDRVDLEPVATTALDALVSQAGGKAAIRSARVTGHADRIGAEEYNLDLSLRRAEAVADYLGRNAGVDPQAIDVAGRGESEPLVGCDGERGSALISCLAPNRRVEVMLDLF